MAKVRRVSGTKDIYLTLLQELGKESCLIPNIAMIYNISTLEDTTAISVVRKNHMRA